MMRLGPPDIEDECGWPILIHIRRYPTGTVSNKGCIKYLNIPSQMGMDGPHFEEFYPDRPVDASHPDLLLDLNRCILCELCVRASHDADGKDVFAIAGHGITQQSLVWRFLTWPFF